MKKYVISDIHGQYQMFKNLIEKLESDNNGDYKLYIIGDIIDRGEGGYDIYRAITSPRFSQKITLIKGNHEKLLCDFLDFAQAQNYEEIADIYFRNGTRSTFANILDRVTDVIPKNYKVDKKSLTKDKVITSNIIWKHTKDIFEEVVERKGLKLKKPLVKYLLSQSYDKMQEMADYFRTLPTYATEETKEKFLMVHSGYVNAPVGDNHYSVQSNYRCNSIEDLKNQKESVLLSCRVTTEDYYSRQFPQERFCNHIIVSGHTSNSKFKNSKGFDTLFNGKEKLNSICLDGSAFHKESEHNTYGQLNCVCLNDLSQIVIKNKAPYKPEVQNFNQIEKE